ncbi:uncharacterized protein LOC132273413 [Cornus florida]|uniref:uncharacterized protein LOC132273413 n=1 Tax=Cornus florida TaxID=4283 RepID=UPI0028A12984|nr:uncharacterized protein LOC132273413 [Cornus florida]
MCTILVVYFNFQLQQLFSNFNWFDPLISSQICRMCITVFVWQAHPLYPLLLLFNRDEYHNRPTKPAMWWQCGEIVGGRDEIGGGTWLASSRGGRVACLTNVMELHNLPRAKSRGHLPLRFLKSKKNPKEFAEEVAKKAHKYNGFNLIVADLSSKSMVYITNRSKGKTVVVEEVSPGIHVLANARLDSPWHKSLRLELKFKELLDEHGDGEIPTSEMVEKLMRDPVKADKTMLPHILNLNWEFNLSSIFVDAVDTPLGRCGTRSTTALTVKAGGEVNFYELYLESEKWKEHTFNYRIQKLIK